MRKKKINPRECESYRIGGYCCLKQRCKYRKTCNTISHCADRLRCHVKIGSFIQCVKFEPTKHNSGLKKSAKKKS